MADVKKYGNPVLKKTCSEVTEFNAELQRITDDMIETMYAEDGVGLAAPQIGLSKRIIVIDPKYHETGLTQPIVLINPRITFFSEETEDYEEGCLSIPDIHISISRSSIVTAEGYSIKGEKIVLEKVDGLTARVLQHEIDHLDGILFVDRATSLRKQLLASKLKKMAKAYSEAVA